VGDSNDNTLVKDARKLVIDHAAGVSNMIEFKGNRDDDILLTISTGNIEKTTTTTRNFEGGLIKRKNNIPVTQITFTDTQQNIKSLFFEVKNHKYADAVQLQIQLIIDVEKEYGKTLLQTDKANYNGGDKNHAISGILSKHESGKLYLSEHYLIFVKEDKDVSKRREMITPLKSVILVWSQKKKEDRIRFIGEEPIQSH
jgi:hypothetical protein